MKRLIILGSAVLISGLMHAQTTAPKTDKTEKAARNNTVNEQEKEKSETKKGTVKNEKTPDKETGTYKGKKVYTDAKGKRYYLNSNNNKTYIDR